ncbi:hypothetical protein [Dendronalium sp. ChiSLP03b]|nr:hypothetical protein [Dendronalium sp. ChiSLP03b]MDZ8209371.1 hypothetical protein [Dendronalium sp. ChiSLP03b]
MNAKRRAIYSKNQAQNTEHRAFYFDIQVLSLNIAPQKCDRRVIFYNAAA